MKNMIYKPLKDKPYKEQIMVDQMEDIIMTENNVKEHEILDPKFQREKIFTTQDEVLIITLRLKRYREMNKIDSQVVQENCNRASQLKHTITSLLRDNQTVRADELQTEVEELDRKTDALKATILLRKDWIEKEAKK